MKIHEIKLGRDHGNRWDERTRGGAPHKPLMLLAILDLMEAGLLLRNFIPYDDELLEAFDLYWSRLYGSERRTNPLQPYWRLQKDDVWQLLPASGASSAKFASDEPTMKEFRCLVLGAEFDGELFQEMSDPEGRSRMRGLLLTQYFDAETAKLLAAGRQINFEAFQLRQDLATRSRQAFQEIWEGPDGINPDFTSESRQLAFRHVVVEAYAHTCAACGTHIRTPAGRSCLEAAHIIPFSVAKNDDPRNGLGLCPLHHWAFDQGMMAVGMDYKIKIHSDASELRASADFLQLNKIELRLPQDAKLHPAKKALEWHWKRFNSK